MLSCAFVFALALLGRAGFGLCQLVRSPAPTALQFPDEQWYWELAESIQRGDGLVGEFGHRAGRMPLYPALLSLAAGSDHGVIYARVAQWFIGAVAALGAALLAARVADELTGLLAGLFVACDPGLIGISDLLLTETLLTTLVVLWWLVGWPLSEEPGAAARGPRLGRRARWWRWVATVALASACVYARPGAILLVVFWSAFVVARRRAQWRAIGGTLLFTAAVAASLVPWAYRNRHVTGQWCWLTTRTGISLYDGVRPGATGAGNLGDVKDHPNVRGLPEHEWNQYFLDESFKAIRSDPGRIFRLGWVKLGRTWSPFLHADEYGSRAIRTVFATWSVVWYALIVVGLLSHRPGAGVCLGLLLPAVMVCCLHFFYVGSVRYRLGAVPTLAVLAAFGAISLLEQRQRARRAGR